MTFDELYEYGMKSEPAKLCIPKELVQSLPRLERINGRIVVQFWYYYQNVMYPFSWDMPMYYAAFDPEEDQLVEMQALTGKNSFFDSWLDLVYWGNGKLAESPEELCRYFATADMKFLLVQRSYLTNETLARNHLMWMAEEGYLSIDKTQGEFCLLSFHAEKVTPDEVLCQWLIESEKGK